MIYHNCVHQGAVYNINQRRQEHILKPKAFEVSIASTVSNIYRNINKFLPNTIKYFTR